LRKYHWCQDGDRSDEPRGPGRDVFPVESRQVNLQGCVPGGNGDGHSMFASGSADRTALADEVERSLADGCGDGNSIHFMHQWFGYSDAVKEEALHGVPLLRQFTGLDDIEDVMPYKSTILRFLHLLKMHSMVVAIIA